MQEVANSQKYERSHVKMGSIVPLGDGAVGKSVISKLLINKLFTRDKSDYLSVLEDTKKSTNIEMQFGYSKYDQDGIDYSVSMQYYIFPGQVQKESSRTVTFSEIMNIFKFFPALKNVKVLLLMYDVSRIYTLKSLENWLNVSIKSKWVHEESLILLLSNKVDIQIPDQNYIDQILGGIYNILQSHGINIKVHNIRSINTSCKTLEGIREVYESIVEHIAHT